MKRTHEVSKLTGIPRTTLQRYEKDGLVKPQRTGANYRSYSRDDMIRLFFIQVYKQLDYSHDEIREILEDPNYDIMQSLNQQRAELYMEAQRIEAQMALIDYLKRVLMDERDVSLEEQIYLLCVYPEYRWVLEAEGDPRLLKLLEKISPYLDVADEWKKSVAKWQRDTALASAQVGGKLSEAEQDALFEQIRTLLEPMSKISGVPMAVLELHIDLTVARARGHKPESDFTQQIIERAVQKLADEGIDEPTKTLIDYAEKQKREESKTLWLLSGTSETEQEVFIKYLVDALEHYMSKN